MSVAENLPIVRVRYRQSVPPPVEPTLSDPSPSQASASEETAPTPAATYEVGYKKPPKATQFKPGQCGNPKGRPKGSRSFSALIREELNKTMVATLKGRRIKVARRKAMAMKLVEQALSGDLRAALILLKHDIDMSEASNSAEPQPLVSAADEAIVSDFLAKFAARGAA